MTKFKEWPDANVDVLVGGTPCQSFSVAGLRKGLDDPRGNLMLTYLAIAAKYRPKWVVWENVPGVLSSNGGLDFASFLRGLEECGYGFAYRVLDAQYFGVPQRRRRVFVVGCLGDWRSAAAVLFEQHSLQGHSAPRRKTRKNNTQVVGTLAASCGGLNRPAGNANELDFCVVAQPITFSGKMSNPQTDVDMTQTLQAKNPMAVCLGGQHPNAGIGIDQSPTLTEAMGAGGGHIPIMAQPIAVGTDLYNCSITGDVSMTLKRGDGNPAINQPTVMQSMAVRRLTPMECERLQGFPDGYTDIKLNGKPTPDGPRYKALGNSMAVPVMRWIGQRIEAVDKIK